MPLGDSLTLGTSAGVTTGTETGYRLPLVQALSAAARGDVDLVGSLANGAFFQQHHEGHGGYNIQLISNNAATWLPPTPKLDGILLMAGTNDCAQFLTGASTRMAALLTQLAGLQPKAKIFLMTIPPIDPAAATGIAPTLAAQFNQELPAVVAERFAAGINVHLVDAGGPLVIADLDGGGIHLSPTGYGKVATTLSSAILAQFP